ncbi:GGDEF domain-containing protein [Acidicapsa ligni]|uniref:GGDEF domain-containing protein n=1 Tax=Acidicapsa ligni TaxID=542300 RepID=UPI0021DFD657|nr:GGDEF domain-containing protein [Acidicapsa ligni]
MLDLPTLVAGQVILAVIFAGVFYGIHRLYPELKGIRYVVGGFIVTAVARRFFMVHVGHAQGIAILLALAASAIMYTATLRHLGSSRSSKLAWFILALFGLAIVQYKELRPDPTLSFVLESAAFLFIRAIWARELFRHAAGRRLLRSFALFLVIYAVYATNILIVRLPYLSAPASRYVDLQPLEAFLLIVNVALSAIEDLFMLLMVGSSIIEQLKQQSLTDPMTGRLNRRGIEQKIAEEVAQSARGSHICSIAMIDLDYFKSINDQFGHSVGDDALRHTAEVILAAVRPYDCLGRVGGDEFVLILPSTDGACALKIAERVCAAIRNTDSDGRFHLSVSIGVAQYEFTDTATSIFERADTALYQAKEAGRGCARYLPLSLGNPHPNPIPIA